MNFNPFKKLSNKQADLIFEEFKYEKYLKRLNYGNVKALGRSHGKITMSHKGGGVKRQYRSLSNYKKEELDFGIIRSIKYDPNRSSFIGLFQYSNGSFSNKVVSSKNSVGQIIKTYKDKTSFMKWGDIYRLRDIPLGMPFHNIESYPGSGPVFTKAAGTYSTILRKGNIRARIILPSERHFALNLDCLATYGICSNKFHRLYKKYKAGTNRLLNKRPVVRGVAMNPIDHPHGGGEGKGRPGRPSVSPWGKLTKGVPAENKDITKKKLVKIK